MRHVVMLSGGASSALVAVRVVERYGPADVVLLFADTKIEDEDTYRFLGDVAQHVGVPVTVIADGRDPWQVFGDVQFLGSTRVDPCSRVLKRDLMRSWLEEHCDPATTIAYVGFDADEPHRIARAAQHWAPWVVHAPLAEPEYGPVHYAWAARATDQVRALGLEPPRLYALGFEHNNCGGFCVKAGIAQFRHLLAVLPERYAQHEAKEREFNERRAERGKGPVSILRDRRGGTFRPYTLQQLREDEERDHALRPELFDVNGAACACFDPADGAEED